MCEIKFPTDINGCCPYVTLYLYINKAIVEETLCKVWREGLGGCGDSYGTGHQ
jgi:hypothetical protein